MNVSEYKCRLAFYKGGKNICKYSKVYVSSNKYIDIEVYFKMARNIQDI